MEGGHLKTAAAPCDPPVLPHRGARISTFCEAGSKAAGPAAGRGRPPKRLRRTRGKPSCPCRTNASGRDATGTSSPGGQRVCSRTSDPSVSMPNPHPENASTRAVLSLVFGILGLTILPCAGPIVAIVTGTGESGGIARAGVILGWIAIALYALAAGLFLLLVLVGGAAALPFQH